MNSNQPVDESWIRANWRKEKVLWLSVGRPYHGRNSFCFGGIPTEKAEIDTDDEGKIVRIRTWAGLNWSARHGRGLPLCDTQRVADTE